MILKKVHHLSELTGQSIPAVMRPNTLIKNQNYPGKQLSQILTSKHVGDSF